MNRGLHFGEPLLNFVSHAYHVNLDTPTRGAGDESDAPVAQIQRAQYFIGDGNLLFRLSAQTYTNGVTDSIGQQQTQTYRGFNRARHKGSRLGNTKMERIVRALRKAAVGFNRGAKRGRILKKPFLLGVSF